MKQYEELIQTETYWLTRFQAMLFNAINEYMKTQQLNRKQLADKLGVSKGYITQVMNGDFDHKISTFIKLVLAAQKVPDLKLISLDDFIAKQSAVIQINTEYKSETTHYFPPISLEEQSNSGIKISFKASSSN
jgi:transcriptional regulator with XRE-family HTH domain